MNFSLTRDSFFSHIILKRLQYLIIKSSGLGAYQFDIASVWDILYLLMKMLNFIIDFNHFIDSCNDLVLLSSFLVTVSEN